MLLRVQTWFEDGEYKALVPAFRLVGSGSIPEAAVKKAINMVEIILEEGDRTEYVSLTGDTDLSTWYVEVTLRPMMHRESQAVWLECGCGRGHVYCQDNGEGVPWKGGVWHRDRALHDARQMLKRRRAQI